MRKTQHNMMPHIVKFIKKIIIRHDELTCSFELSTISPNTNMTSRIVRAIKNDL